MGLWTSGLLVAAVLPWLTPGEEPAAPPPLLLLIFNAADTHPLVMKVAREEVESILGDIGVTAEWTDTSAGTLVPKNRFHVKVMVMPKDPSGWNLPFNTLGVTYIVDEVPDTIYVFMPVVEAAVADHRFPRKIGEAVGRVIVHELAHVMNPARGHADAGLMAPRQRRRNLFGTCLDLDQSSAVAFRRGLARATGLTEGLPGRRRPSVKISAGSGDPRRT